MKRQQGLTMISWLVILVVAGFFVMVGLRVGPVYLEYYSVKNVLKGLNHEPLISRKPVNEIREMLFRRLDINNVNSVTRENVKIKRAGKVTTIEVNYEQRRPIAGNMDVIMTFEDKLEMVAD